MENSGRTMPASGTSQIDIDKDIDKSIEVLTTPSSQEDVKSLLNEITLEWFFSKFKEFSLPQLFAVPEIHKLNNILVSAPTGGTKTLTSTVSVINELVNLSLANALEDRVYCIYINPLRALSRDIEVNLKAPLAEIKKIAEQKQKTIDIRIAVRTGDTTTSEKAAMLKKPPHILILTPETLAILLSSSRFVEHLKKVQYVIVDEIHALAENKRGTHLALSLEHLQHLCQNEITRIGLSATISPLDTVAKFLVGPNRPCKIADVRFLKKKDFKIISPVPDLVNTTYAQQHNSLYRLLDNLIQEHKTTLIFTNTRSATERVVHHLKEKFPGRYVGKIGAHHGSLGRKHRFDIEDRMRKGELKACVSSTSLELGLDIGFIDLVICLGSPKSIARLSQRFGRAGHRLHDTVKGRVIVLDRDDLIECSLMLKNAIEGKIDKIHIPENCLDVLAQQVHGMALSQKWSIHDLYDVIKKSYSYRNLKEEEFMEIIKYLSGEFASLEDRNIYAKIWYDPETKMIGRRGKMGRVIYMTNIGTIPDETAVVIKVKDHVIGTIEEAFLERLSRGDIFVLGGDVYQFLFSRGMVAQVRPATGKQPTVPSWFSEMLPLSFDLALEIQKFRREIEHLFVNDAPKQDILDFIHRKLYVEENAANAIYNYLNEQYLYAKIPHDKRLLIEYFTDEATTKKYVIFHSLYGRRVNDVLARAVAFAISKLTKRDVEFGLNDNGFYIASTKNIQALRAFQLLKPEELRKVAEAAVEKTEILKRRFRHCATRALMILREYKGHRKKVGRQQVSSMILLKAVKKIDPNFSILREAKREVLEDLMDVENATKVLKAIKSGDIEIAQVHTSIPSPFAFNLVTQGFTDILKMEDKIDFIRRMHQLILAKIGKNHKIDVAQ